MKVTSRKYTKQTHFYGDTFPAVLETLLRRKNIRSFIDLGCGDGAILYALKKKGLTKGKEVTAVDISKVRMSQVKKIDCNFNCLIADVCRLDNQVKSASQDLVISSQVIEHLSDQEKFLQQALRILRPGGYFFLSTVFKKKYGWYFYRNKGEWVLDPTHVREYTNENQLVPLIKKNSFKIISNSKKNYYFPVTDFILKRLGFSNDVYQKKFLFLFLRMVKIPIIGYYDWELLVKKETCVKNKA